MANSDHATRTLLLSQKVPELLLISRGSTSNVDLETLSLESGRSQIRAFNLTNMTGEGYDYTTDGLRLGWGLRNSVGLAEHPDTGGIYSVENSVDEIMREGKDVHQDNPGEEMVSSLSYHNLQKVLLTTHRIFMDTSTELIIPLKGVIMDIHVALLLGHPKIFLRMMASRSGVTLPWEIKTARSTILSVQNSPPLG